MVVDHGSLTLEKLHSTLSSKFFIIQVSYHPSPLSSKSPLEQTPLFSINLGFSFPVVSLGWKVFSLTISIPYDLLVFFPSLFYWLGDFLLTDFLSGFPPQSSHQWFRRFFTSDMTF